ncbi:MAG: hypothetical protein KBE02_04405 [Sulfurospirillum sp.]|nr:hypothetical protein [Sulfurospirillum sp.]
MRRFDNIFSCYKNPKTLEELPVICNDCTELCYLNSMGELMHSLKADIAQYNNMNKNEEVIVERLINDAVKKGEIFILNRFDANVK